ncbi:MAG TPA: dethiobiotin synthase [Fibrobacteria bacterium]|nr:dethiobiotin synthase [Fibrobacteria bacterium]
MGSALFITGTGTDVGKSALSLAVLLWARNRGLRAVYHKPVQCGTSAFGASSGRTGSVPAGSVEGGDAEWIETLAGGGIATQVTYRLRMPASPHLAAEREGAALDPERIRSEASSLRNGADLLVLEGAGGPAVPLDRRGSTLAALAADLSMPCLLACAPGLGTLHHTLSTLAYLESKRVRVAGFAFCHREAAEPELSRDNAETLRGLTGLPFFGHLPFHANLARGVGLTREEAEAWIAPLAPSLDAWHGGRT